MHLRIFFLHNWHFSWPSVWNRLRPHWKVGNAYKSWNKLFSTKHALQLDTSVKNIYIYMNKFLSVRHSCSLLVLLPEPRISLKLMWSVTVVGRMTSRAPVLKENAAFWLATSLAHRCHSASRPFTLSSVSDGAEDENSTWRAFSGSHRYSPPILLSKLIFVVSSHEW